MSGETARCVICGRPENLGIIITGHLICHDCEQQITSTEVDDPAYIEIVRKLRQLWQAANA